MAIKLDGKTIALIILGGILLLSMMGAITLNDQGLQIQDTEETPPPSGQPPVGVVPSETLTAKIDFRIRDALTNTATGTGDTAYMDVVVANNGEFNFLDTIEQTEFAADPETSSLAYSSGDEIIFRVTSDNDPTSGSETYPRMFYVENLQDGATIYAFPLANPQSALSGSIGAYTVNVGVCEPVGVIQWVPGDTPKWDVGYFDVYGRAAKASITTQMTAGGTVLTTFTDGATWEDTDAEINANHTMTGDKEDIDFQVLGDVNDVCWGLPYLAVSASGEVSQYSGVLVITTDALGINTDELYADGWKPINKPDLTADLGFYYEITTQGIPNARGERFSISVPFTVEDSGLAASTEYEMEGWMLDSQKISNVAAGSTTTSLPGTNGFISEHGLDTVIHNRALTVSSGSAATMQLLTHFTTNS